MIGWEPAVRSDVWGDVPPGGTGIVPIMASDGRRSRRYTYRGIRLGFQATESFDEGF